MAAREHIAECELPRDRHALRNRVIDDHEIVGVCLVDRERGAFKNGNSMVGRQVPHFHVGKSGHEILHDDVPSIRAGEELARIDRLRVKDRILAGEVPRRRVPDVDRPVLAAGNHAGGLGVERGGSNGPTEAVEWRHLGARRAVPDCGLTGLVRRNQLRARLIESDARRGTDCFQRVH